MEKKELINKITDFSSDLMEKHFPKGECKERGQALIFNAEMIVYVSDLFEKELDKAREEGRKGGSKKLYRSISKELYKLYSDIECLGDLRDDVYDLSDKYEKLSKLKSNKKGLSQVREWNDKDGNHYKEIATSGYVETVGTPHLESTTTYASSEPEKQVETDEDADLLEKIESKLLKEGE